MTTVNAHASKTTTAKLPHGYVELTVIVPVDSLQELYKKVAQLMSKSNKTVRKPIQPNPNSNRSLKKAAWKASKASQGNSKETPKESSKDPQIEALSKAKTLLSLAPQVPSTKLRESMLKSATQILAESFSEGSSSDESNTEEEIKIHAKAPLVKIQQANGLNHLKAQEMAIKSERNKIDTKKLEIEATKLNIDIVAKSERILSPETKKIDDVSLEIKKLESEIRDIDQQIVDSMGYRCDHHTSDDCGCVSTPSNPERNAKLRRVQARKMRELSLKKEQLKTANTNKQSKQQEINKVTQPSVAKVTKPIVTYVTDEPKVTRPGVKINPPLKSIKPSTSADEFKQLRHKIALLAQKANTDGSTVEETDAINKEVNSMGEKLGVSHKQLAGTFYWLKKAWVGMSNSEKLDCLNGNFKTAW